MCVCVCVCAYSLMHISDPNALYLHTKNTVLLAIT